MAVPSSLLRGIDITDETTESAASTSSDASTNVEVKVVTDESTSSGAYKSAATVRTTKHCLNCNAEIDINAAMCPKCGVMQNKRPAGKSKMFCHNCGAEIDINAEICPKCGVRQKSGGVSTTGEKSPIVAAVLSFLIPGLGQMYVGKMKRGLVLLAAALLLLVTGVGYIVVMIASIYDAYKLAEGEPGPLAFIDQYTHEE
ncbi:MAG: zinc ribbon domain-containing protein [Methanotrichaceae archaeon]|nr:zinc ribbon domain-containing protein [Methanotrichaceae archaeon]